MSNELRHEVTMLVNGESRRVVVEDQAGEEPPEVEVPTEAQALTDLDTVPGFESQDTQLVSDESQGAGFMQTVKGILGFGS